MSARHIQENTSGEQRQGHRYTLLLRAAKLVTRAGEFLCLVRDVSDGGLKARLFHPLELRETCEIELGSGGRIALECAWQRGGQAGFRFMQGPIEVHRLIDESGPFPKRHLRLRLNRPLPIRVTSNGLAEAGQLCDISQHGGAIAVDRRLPLHAQVRIDAVELPALHARVCWRRGGMHGLVFQESFRLDELAQLAWRLQIPAPSGLLRPNCASALTSD
jgi:hypothetical protein